MQDRHYAAVAIAVATLISVALLHSDPYGGAVALGIGATGIAIVYFFAFIASH
jgi:acetyl-CoA acetyltransferase